MQYRADIQIMRGIAVLVVVLFHLDFDLFTNGFLGVDVFFVLSGFLMAVLYKEGKVKEFYQRRAARLLPAYFATIIFTIVLSAFITLASDHAQVVSQSIWASFFSSNIGFWSQASYFSSKYFNPLLHLWSLAVEIQFYILVPFLFWVYLRSKSIVLLVFLLSMLASFLIIYINSKTSFFITPFRVWQFLVGSFVAVYVTNKGAVRYDNSFLGLLSLLALLGVLAWYPMDVKAESFLYGHPGFSALITTTLAAMVLAFGLPKNITDSKIGKFFSKIGDWSYSIYLAHFPIIVLFLYAPLSGTFLKPNSFNDVMMLFLLIAIGSAFLYLLFDRRRWHVTFKSSAVTVVFILLISVLSVQLSKFKHTNLELNIMASYDDSGQFRCGRVARIFDEMNISKYFACEVTSNLERTAEPVLLLGDSTADAIKTSLARSAESNNFRLYTTASNRAASGYISVEKVIEETKKLNIKTIIIHFYSPFVKQVFDRNINAKLIDSGFNIVWIAPVPYFDESVPKIAYKLKGDADFRYAPENKDEVSNINKKLLGSKIKVFDPWPLLCTDNMCEISNEMGQAYYHDSLHMSLTGAEKLDPLFNDLFKYINKTNLDAHGDPL